MSKLEKDIVLSDLVAALGEEYVSNDPAIRIPYSRDQTSNAWDHFRLPDYVVMPENTEEVQRVVVIANKHKIPVIPWSTGANVAGKTIPIQGGIMMEFKRMNQLTIDESTMTATVQPYVPQLRLQVEAKKRGLRTDLPGAPSSTGVISNFCTTFGFHFKSNKYGWGAEKIVGLEMVLPTGEILRTGYLALNEYGAENVAANALGMDLNGLPYNSFGQFGIVTQMTVKLFPRIKPEHGTKKIVFANFREFENAVKAYAEVSKEELGIGMGAAGPAYWTACFPFGKREDMLSFLKKSHPMGILVWVEIEGTKNQIDYQEKQVRQIFTNYKAEFVAGDLLSQIISSTNDEELKQIIKRMKRLFGQEFDPYWVKRSRGLMDFSETPTRAFALIGGLHMREVTNTAEYYLKQYKIWKELLKKYNYKGADEGLWSMFLSNYGANNWVCELDMLWDPQNMEARLPKKNISKALIPEYLKLGNYHHDSHGIEWDYLGPHYGVQYEIVKQMKRLFDPNNIMHRGIYYP